VKIVKLYQPIKLRTPQRESMNAKVGK